MTAAEEALANAIGCEMVLYAYRKNKDGVVVSFVVHPSDVPDELATANIGSRWVSALVQVGDDEKPIPPTGKDTRKSHSKQSPATPRSVTDKLPAEAKREKMDWREVQPAAQAGIRCGEASFVAFLRDNYGEDFNAMENDAAATVRFLCGVNSRAELGVKHAARVIWHQLDSQYQAWKVVEHA